MRKIAAIVLITMFLCSAKAQEFRCSVQVNYQKLLTTTQSYSSDADQKVFESMKQAIEDFVNMRQWTNVTLSPEEQIDCSLSLVLSSRTSLTDFTGQLQIQLRRPVYNSSYSTGLFNHMEQNFQFSYNESQPLEFDFSNFYGNLTSTIGYYCYLMLGIYFDSYAPGGGEPFFAMAQQVQQAAEASGFYGWSSSDDSKSRYWFVENHTNGAYEDIHAAYYDYHRLGLDMMTKDQAKARQSILTALEDLRSVHQARSNLLSVQQFVDVKIEELVSIFTPAPATEQKQLAEIISEVSPIHSAKLRNFNRR